MSDLVDRLSVLQVLLAERHTDHYATVCEAIAEVRRLRERETKARELADKFLRSMDNANSTIAQAVAATELRDSLRRWLETE